MAGATKLRASANDVQLQVALAPRSYTRATLPAGTSVAQYGILAVTDGTKATPFVYSDGTNWRYMLDGTLV